MSGILVRVSYCGTAKILHFLKELTYNTSTLRIHKKKAIDSRGIKEVEQALNFLWNRYRRNLPFKGSSCSNNRALVFWLKAGAIDFRKTLEVFKADWKKDVINVLRDHLPFNVSEVKESIEEFMDESLNIQVDSSYLDYKPSLGGMLSKTSFDIEVGNENSP